LAEIVNLRLMRKRAARDKADAHAAERRTAHGIPKQERQRAESERTNTTRKLDQHRIDPGDRK
jgi:hypothetical protein